VGFVIIFFIAWLTIVVFTVMRKRLSLIENCFVYMVILVININWSWIVFEELDRIIISTAPLKNTAFLIVRSIIVPLVIVGALNIHGTFFSAKSWYIGILSVIVLSCVIAIGRYFDVLTYVHWSIVYDILYFMALHVIASVTLKFFQAIGRREVKAS